MRFAQMRSVRVQMIAVILGAILTSWVVSSGIMYYVFHHQYMSIRQQMLARPDVYPVPIPEPHWTLRDFLLGPRGPMLPPPPPPPQIGVQPPPPGVQPPPGQPARRSAGNVYFRRYSSEWSNFSTLVLSLRIGTALLLALLVGWLVSRRFTGPLDELARGARAFSEGQLDHRIPPAHSAEFSEVAVAMHDMAERLAGQMKDLREDAVRRQQMLANVAHELRSPVMTMRTMAGALADGLAKDPERNASAVKSLVRTSDRLLHLVTDLLELARLDLHELPVHPLPIEIRPLLEACLRAHAEAAEHAGITLLPLEQTEQVRVMADPDRLTQVVDNMLGNAISHAGQGARVTVSVFPGDPARLIIADTGKGIPARHMPYIFDPFYRADDVRSPGNAHAGLGLSISRSLMEAQGGALQLSSTEGRRTTVVITLPVTKE